MSFNTDWIQIKIDISRTPTAQLIKDRRVHLKSRNTYQALSDKGGYNSAEVKKAYKIIGMIDEELSMRDDYNPQLIPQDVKEKEEKASAFDVPEDFIKGGDGQV